MIKKISFNSTEIIVDDCYSYIYEDGKNVLRIKASEVNTGFTNLKTLDGYSGVILYIEDEIPKTEYTGYSADFVCKYDNGIFDVELQRAGATEVALKEAQLEIDLLTDSIDYIFLEVLPMLLG